jgi:hypothetical protein
MNRDELAELILAHLYECVETAGHPYFFFRLNRFFAEAGIRDFHEIVEALDILEAKGLVLASADPTGEVTAMIHGAGCVYVEEGGETGIIPKYLKDPASFLPNRQDSGESAGPSHERLVLGATIHGRLLEIVETAKSDPLLAGDRFEDLMRDIETLNLQLGRQTRNDAFVNPLLDQMAAIPSVRSLVMDLKGLINAYLV